MMLDSFFQVGPLPNNMMQGTYDFKLVFASYCVAVFASYTTIELSEKLRSNSNRKIANILWLVFGSVIMGLGIWSMHFVGMLSFKMNMPMHYDGFLTFFSLIVSILASMLALFVINRQKESLSTQLVGGVIMGLSIASMHYVGMSAMQVSMNIHYLPKLFFLSIVVAILASEAALWLAIQAYQGDVKFQLGIKTVSAMIMGAAICGMHYIGMEAAVFTPKIQEVSHSIIINQEGLPLTVSLIAFCILGGAFWITAINDVKWHQKIELARQAGMSEIASSVLHNIGNVLNSVNVAVNMLKTKMNESELQVIVDLKELVNKNKSNFSDFIQNDPQGKELPDYINLLSDYYVNEKTKMTKEIDAIINHVQHIRDIIATQQSISGLSKYQEIVNISNLLDEALAITSFDFNKTQINIVKEYEALSPVVLDKIKLLQVLINLMQNAKHALAASSNSVKTLKIKSYLSKNNKFIIQIVDNGVGISQENLTKIFSYGFTTKKNGHGFGLHSGILMIQEMKGTLTVTSAGLDQGATFTIELPYTTQSNLHSKQQAQVKEQIHG